MPAAASRMAGVAVTSGTHPGIYLFGGSVSGSPSVSTQVIRYNPASDTYDTGLAALPIGRDSATAVFTNGLVYVMGGRDQNLASTSDNYAYDPSANTITTKASIPQATSAQSAALGLTGQIYVTGGTTPTSLFLYDPTTNSWATGPNLITSRNSHGSAVFSDTYAYFTSGSLVLFGGTNAVSNGTVPMDLFRPERVMYLFQKN